MKNLLWLILLWPGLAHAVLVNMAGMETGDTSEFQTLTGSAVGSTTTVVHTGTYSLRVNPTTSGTGSVRLGSLNTGGASVSSGVNAATGTAGFYFQYLTKPAANDEQFFEMLDTLVNTKLALRLNSAGKVVACDNTTVGVATGTTVLASGTWYLFNVLVTSGTSAFYEVKINNVVEVSGTANLFNNGTDIVRIGKSANRNSQSVDFYYDDIVWSSVTYPVDGRIKILLTSANGANQNFTVGAGAGSHFQLVNEVPTDSDTSYVVSTAITISSETYKFQTSATAGISGTVNAIRVGGITKQDGASSGVLKNLVNSSTTSFISLASYATNTTYTLRTSLLINDPNGTGGWSLGALDALDAGIREGSATNKSRLSSYYLMVHYTPSAAKASLYIQ